MSGAILPLLAYIEKGEIFAALYETPERPTGNNFFHEPCSLKELIELFCATLNHPFCHALFLSGTGYNGKETVDSIG
jgi:hypothetical protein